MLAEAAQGEADERASSEDLVLAIDIGATNLRAAVVRTDGSVFVRASGPTPIDEGAQGLVLGCLARLEEVRSRLGPSERTRIRGVGISAIGPLDAREGVILRPPNVPKDLRDVRIVGPIRERFGLPTFMERDTNVAALAEMTFGAGRGVRDLLYLTVSTGVGGAIVSRGELVTGAAGIAGELGHMPIDMHGPPCGCGDRGHLEALSSGSGIAEAAAAAVSEGLPTVLRDIAERIAPEPLAAVHVAQGEASGDAVAGSIMKGARDSFAAAMVGYVNVFNPELVIVGGALARAEAERLLAPAREAVAAFAFDAAARAVSIVPSPLLDDVGLLGAVPLVARGLEGGRT